MYILSIILATIVSLVNASFMVLAIFGATVVNSSTSGNFLTPLSYIYSTILPIVFFFFIYTLGSIKKDPQNKSLCLAFGLCLLQVIVSVILYNMNISNIVNGGFSLGQVLPSAIIEGIVIIGTFVGAIIFSIKSSGGKTSTKRSEQNSFSFPIGIFSWTNLGIGIYSILSVIIFSVTSKSIDDSGSFLGIILNILAYITRYVTLLVPVTFSTAVIATISHQPKKYIILSWIGTITLSLTYVVLYVFNYFV